MACVRGIGPYQLGLRRDRGVRLVAPTAQRLRRDPRSLATCSIALVSDEYEPRDSVNSLTAFASNSGVYLVPFAMVPSSPIELGEMRNKNQFISEYFRIRVGWEATPNATSQPWLISALLITVKQPIQGIHLSNPPRGLPGVHHPA